MIPSPELGNSSLNLPTTSTSGREIRIFTQFPPLAPPWSESPSRISFYCPVYLLSCSLALLFVPSFLACVVDEETKSASRIYPGHPSNIAANHRSDVSPDACIHANKPATHSPAHAHAHHLRTLIPLALYCSIRARSRLRAEQPKSPPLPLRYLRRQLAAAGRASPRSTTALHGG